MSTVVNHHIGEYDKDSTDVFGFWLYILTDCILFGCLFATHIVLSGPMAYGPALKNFIELDYVLLETFVLLASNFCYGLAMLALYKNKKALTQLWLIATFVFGAGFVGLELNEFVNLTREGFAWYTSGAASSFFALVGTHGLHVAFGLIWIVVMIVQLSVLDTAKIKKRFLYLGLFWNFLDIVWIFIFSIVYLLGVL